MTATIADTPDIAPRIDPEAWLRAALHDGLPEPTLTRWQPLRVGIVNLWEYDNAQFWFADGRMVLRGGNGAGKTKVLELTTLMLMRGEVAPSILDPFGSQHRSMRYNLLPSGEADDPREPADSGLGYAWVEFGRREPDGESRYFVCGVGASAKRGTGTATVNPWQFITALRPGPQLRLVHGRYPIEEKELKKLPDVWVRNNAAQYRERIARELFELDPESYDNLTELLKQLRKPKLGERLNPTSLADTLRDSLPPLAGHEVSQLAEGWEHLEQLRRAVEQTEESAFAVADFVHKAWRPWVAATVRLRADALAEATTALDNTTRAKRQAEQTLVAATAELVEVEGEQAALEVNVGETRTERDELIESQAYRDAVTASQRVKELQGIVHNLRSQHDEAMRRMQIADSEAGRARTAAVNAESELAAAQAQVREAAQVVTSRAPAAGLAESAQRSLAGFDGAALTADLDARLERFAQLRRLHGISVTAEHAVEAAAHKVALLREEADRAAHEEEQAVRSVQAEVGALQAAIREWGSQAVVAACDDEQVEAWCDDVTELTRIDRKAGTVVNGRSVIAAIADHVDRVNDALAAERTALQRRWDPLAERAAATAAELEAVQAETEAAPPPPSLWRRRSRPATDAAAGAPLWRCVEPVAGAADGLLDVIEASLAAAGLLDAWLEPSPSSPAAGPLDTLITAGVPHQQTLASVLAPTPTGGLTVARINAVLTGIGWYAAAPTPGSSDGAWLAADGQWSLGQLHGRAEPAEPASFIGATAREAARQRRIANLEQELAALRAALAHLDAQLSELQARAVALRRERERIPEDSGVRRTAAVLADRARRTISCAGKAADADEVYRIEVGRRDAAVAQLAQFASEHRFPTTGLDDVDAALRHYGRALDSWKSTVELWRLRAERATEADEHAIREAERAEGERGAAERVGVQLRNEEVRLREASNLLGADHAQRLLRRDDLEQRLADLDVRGRQLRARHGKATEDAVRAKLSLADHEQRRQTAETNRDIALASWWQLVDAGLAGVVGVKAPDRRVVETALTGVRAVRREVTVVTDPASLERAGRHCFSALETLRQNLLPNRDARVDDTDDTLPPRIFILAEAGASWQMPHDAAETLAAQVRAHREAYDAEQHTVLTTLLESTFIEHLKDRLDHTERTFSRINDELARHPTRRGHAVRLLWQPDPVDPDASAVVSSLRQGYQQLVPERQKLVREFLARRIEAARAEVSGPADWKERLAAALDYRRWLRITLQYRTGAGGAWAPFDAAKHGAKSGGEKVVLLSQPLFAAAVVAYGAASARAPRWVWLDEAMTGVDAEVKASFMGLTVGFDLDIMLTAFDEWCRYETVPAVAIYDLSRHPHLPGVDSQPYLWCGGTLSTLDNDRLGASVEESATDDDLLSLLTPES